MEQMQSNVFVKEYSEDLPGTSSYESAIEALSSLITRKKRGDRSSVGGKYGKLERMSIYLKILGLEEKIGGLKL
ncbi:folylpolyglutamate synthase isoform X2 [Prunus yedoensis var. nudiflora]|uniref:Folylpolyglutamate synthase isoform X2 n=1 Tax=Prunus yedoensis var. nudiflora TaxID=2094558 RepID=A0A314YPX3_PRUYE|nr:folylpolyglutamate synthase isoform X2 [Prunus yedoensis var. nudiflora]